MSAAVRPATPDDAPGLLDLARRCAMPGRLRLARPAVLRPWVDTVVAEANGRIVACGQRVRRHRYFNGDLVPTAYLSSLRVSPDCRGDGRLIRRGFGLLGDLHAAGGRPPTFTSVMADNAPTLALLGRPRRGLPAYEFLGEYVTVVAGGRSFRRLAPAVRPDRPPQFAAPVGPRSTPSDPPFSLVGFAGRLSWLDRLLPAGGRPVWTSCLWQRCREDAYALARLAPRNRYLVGGHPADPFVAALARRPGVRVLRSRLFAVRWPGDDWALDGRPASPEVADL